MEDWRSGYESRFQSRRDRRGPPGEGNCEIVCIYQDNTPNRCRFGSRGPIDVLPVDIARLSALSGFSEALQAKFAPPPPVLVRRAPDPDDAESTEAREIRRLSHSLTRSGHSGSSNESFSAESLSPPAAPARQRRTRSAAGTATHTRPARRTSQNNPAGPFGSTEVGRWIPPQSPPATVKRAMTTSRLATGSGRFRRSTENGPLRQPSGPARWVRRVDSGGRTETGVGTSSTGGGCTPGRVRLSVDGDPVRVDGGLAVGVRIALPEPQRPQRTSRRGILLDSVYLSGQFPEQVSVCFKRSDRYPFRRDCSVIGVLWVL